MKLKSVIGYNGNGRGNMVWHPDSGTVKQPPNSKIKSFRPIFVKKLNLISVPVKYLLSEELVIPCVLNEAIVNSVFCNCVNLGGPIFNGCQFFKTLCGMLFIGFICVN